MQTKAASRMVTTEETLSIAINIALKEVRCSLFRMLDGIQCDARKNHVGEAVADALFRYSDLIEQAASDDSRSREDFLRSVMFTPADRHDMRTA